MNSSVRITLFACFFLTFTCVYGLRCYECQTEDGNCQSGSCDGSFCFKRESMDDGKTKTTKGCDSIGVNACQGIQITGTGGSNCQCNDREWCNSATGLPESKFLIAAVLLFALIFSIFN